jgi:hypothetical protein
MEGILRLEMKKNRGYFIFVRYRTFIVILSLLLISAASFIDCHTYQALGQTIDLAKVETAEPASRVCPGQK